MVHHQITDYILLFQLSSRIKLCAILNAALHFLSPLSPISVISRGCPVPKVQNLLVMRTLLVNHRNKFGVEMQILKDVASDGTQLESLEIASGRNMILSGETNRHLFVYICHFDLNCDFPFFSSNSAGLAS